ncbi:MAG: hypothetical protein IIB06_10515 [Bacteroidetes bacterium]|nr:hypothetical protein [Bacteroidota bacterium]
MAVLAGVTSYVLNSDELYFQFYGEQLSYERIVELIEIQNKWLWLGYLLLPIIYFIKFFLISCVLLMGIFILGLEVRFQDVFKITVFSEFIFFIPMLMKLVWFGFIERDYSLQELIDYAPLSLDNILDVTETSPWLSPLLKSISVFELAYWMLLGYGLYQVLEKPFKQTMGLVAASYGSAWIVWQVFVIFLMINFSA